MWGKNNKFGIKPNPPKFRTEMIAVPKTPTPLNPKRAAKSTSASTSTQALKPKSSKRNLPPTSSSPEASNPSGRVNNKRKATNSPAPIWDDDSSDDQDDEANQIGRKSRRQKTDSSEPGFARDPGRQLRSEKAFTDQDGGIFKMIHAADIAGGSKHISHDLDEEKAVVQLKYPSASQHERYTLLTGRWDIDPLKDIQEVTDLVTSYYLTDEQAQAFKEPNSGILRQIEKAKNILSKAPTSDIYLSGFKEAVAKYNIAIEECMKSGALAKNLDNMHDMPLELVNFILQQVYDRAVSPEVDALRQAQDKDKSNSYGELHAPLISRIFKETGMKSGQVFVDMGSGVGNVVIQAALEIGCESWGCEMMLHHCKLAKAQKDEFAARCRLWGIQPGKVHLRGGDFLENQDIHQALRKADVVLINNEVFSAELNQHLTDLFLDLKDGCQVVSLKTFVPSGHVVTQRNRENPINLFTNRRMPYYKGEVSWSNKDGDYFIATKDTKRLANLQSRLS